jgi:hypothetical protein
MIDSRIMDMKMVTIIKIALLLLIRNDLIIFNEYIL